MVRATGRNGIAIVAVLAFVYGLFSILGGLAGLVTPGPIVDTVVSAVQLLLGFLLLPTAVGLVRGRRWSQLLGILGFVGIPAVQLLPVVIGASAGVPLPGVFVATACALYLSLASEEFGDEPVDRPTPEDDDPEYTHRPWR